MYSLIRRPLFHLESEKAHRFALNLLSWLPSFCIPTPQTSVIERMGLKFSHPIGLAAGMDKDGCHVNALAKLGFSFIEVGTVTPKPQVGNALPRLFRLAEDEAIINRMGFNNQGVDALVAQLQKRRWTGVLGVNIGKNKDTPIDMAGSDYQLAFEKVYPYADYITINISSPNTPDLRRLQEEDFFNKLLNDLLQTRLQQADRLQRWVPMLVKLSPDESNISLRRLALRVAEMGLEGIIVTNTTASRSELINKQFNDEPGGLSGRPLRFRANECMRLLKSELGNALTLVGVGGIDSAAAARERLEAGADLLQLYTGLIYKGPSLVADIANHL